MQDSKSDYLEVKILDHVLRGVTYTPPTDIYVALFSASPDDDDDGTEVVGGGYARQVATFNAASTVGGLSSATNDGDITFTNMPTVTVTHIGLYDASSAGELLYWGTLAESKALTSGDQFTIQDEQLIVEER